MSTRSSTGEAFLITGEGAEAVAPGLWIVRGQGNTFVAEVDAGLVVVDSGPGGKVTQGMIDALRTVSDRPVHAICFSHGHIGYNSGLPLWLAHVRQRGDAPPRVIAHANLPRRAARYRDTMALQERMAELQFRREPGALASKLPVHDPEEVFESETVIGDPLGRHVVLMWSPSETDDAVALWYPTERVLYGGPAVIDSIPNLGTPFRTQRDTLRWADTLERLATLQPRRVVREFGPCIEGEQEVQRVLLETARALRWVRDEVVRLMNQGLGEREILDIVRFPPDLFSQPWMQPTYGDPHWIVRDVYRSENGWWDRNPTHLHPASPSAVSQALARALIDKPAILAEGRRLAEQGEWQLALHVIDLLALLDVDDPDVHTARGLKAQWLRQRASGVRSFVSKSLFHGCADLLEKGQQARFCIH